MWLINHLYVQSKTSSLLQIKGSSTTSSLVHISSDPVPHKTARISRSQFAYEFFKMNPGQKILWLHFNPAPYKGYKRFKDLFSVEVGPFTLLSNFSASLTADALGVDSFTKEFCINIQENQGFNIIFSPANSQSYAFINGIQIISVPPSLSYFHGGVLQVVGQQSLINVDNSTALEIFHRLNIKQDSVTSSAGDISDIFGMWETVNNRKANKMNNNITWKISVDVGLWYLVRIHFSEPGLETAGVMFKVLVKSMRNDACVLRFFLGQRLHNFFLT
ncbi:hypothetical protein BUALT_Bualt07G0012100 [Buddleja alternifolia]|uniref:Uncharacterized protein n=1 Tax=Buddleja alternifolia TaxID=168488 RepID=A0AAV6X791_9LAMI|nr:hypothetical protein BUALT_Bualt07G0012100 [Buddleja alternifolia]